MKNLSDNFIPNYTVKYRKIVDGSWVEVQGFSRGKFLALDVQLFQTFNHVQSFHDTYRIITQISENIEDNLIRFVDY